MMFTIQDIINTLNQIDVHGKANLDRMLGVIYALESMLQTEKIDPPREEPTAEGGLTDG